MKPDQLSKTAAFIAIKFYGLTRMTTFRSIFDNSVPEFYNQLVQKLPPPLRYYHFWLKLDWIRRLFIWSEELLLPGDLLHIVARKWYIQKMTRDLVEKGCQQIIVLGAGFDHLAHNFSQQGISCIECDAPYMAEQKRQFFREAYPGTKHPSIIEAYLPEDQLDAIFRSSQHIDPDKKTVIVAEGFFDYLNKPTVKRTLLNLSTYFTHNPNLISTHFALEELSPFHQRVYKSSVQMVGENLQLRTPMSDFKTLLSDNSFKIEQMHESQDIREKMHVLTGASLQMLKGFYIFSAK